MKQVKSNKRTKEKISIQNNISKRTFVTIELRWLCFASINLPCIKHIVSEFGTLR